MLLTSYLHILRALQILKSLSLSAIHLQKGHLFFLTTLLIKDEMIKAFHNSPIKNPVNRLQAGKPLIDRFSRFTCTFPAEKCFGNDDNRAKPALIKAFRKSMMTI